MKLRTIRVKADLQFWQGRSQPGETILGYIRSFDQEKSLQIRQRLKFLLLGFIQVLGPRLLDQRLQSHAAQLCIQEPRHSLVQFVSRNHAMPRMYFWAGFMLPVLFQALGILSLRLLAKMRSGEQA